MRNYLAVLLNVFLFFLPLLLSSPAHAVTAINCFVTAEPLRVKVGQEFTVRWVTKPVDGQPPAPTKPYAADKKPDEPVFDNKLSLELGAATHIADSTPPPPPPGKLPPPPPKPPENSTALYYGQYPGDPVKDKGSRKFTRDKAGSYTFGVGIKGPTGGYRHDCNVYVRVGEPEQRPHSIRLLSAKRETLTTTVQVQLELDLASLKPSPKNCAEAGAFSVSAGDGVNNNLPGLNPGQPGKCTLDYSMHFSNGHGALTATFYRGKAAAPGVQEILAETVVVIEEPVPAWAK